jgi:uncharacterized protein (DUF2249 family)
MAPTLMLPVRQDKADRPIFVGPTVLGWYSWWPSPVAGLNISLDMRCDFCRIDRRRRYGTIPHMTTVEMDNRGMSPPEPMVRILAGLATLEQGDRLQVLMDREPLLLYPELTRRGFGWTVTSAPGATGYVLQIQRLTPG